MYVLQASEVEKAFGDRVVLRGCDLIVRPGDRVGLVGYNGSGKSTLLRILAGQLPPDHGEVRRAGRLGLLDQDPALPGATVADALDDALGWHQRLVDDYHAALEAHDTERAATLQDALDLHGWTVDHRMDAVCTRLGVPDRDARVDQLSGGEARRVALARALVSAPDLLMLDEPTNHIDADAAEWLQSYLTGYRGAVVLVTHDRYLLEAVAERIVEVEDGRCVDYEGSYTDYLITRAERQIALRRAEDNRLRMIAREAAWAARSPAARSTKQKARLQRLDALRDQRALPIDRDFSLDLRTGGKRSRTVIELHAVTKGYSRTPLLRGLTLTLNPGDRLGVIGPNGAGKSTLLRVLSGEEPPDSGELLRAPRLQVAVLDQHRTGLDDDDTVFHAAGGGASHVTLGGEPVHVAGFLGRFLFPTEALDQKVGALSGGEKARLLLARLMLQGAGLLLLDEPTNDLDLLTLRVLEEALLAYDGAAVIVSHDRAFVDRVCTHVLAFEGEGVTTRYASRLQALEAADARRAEAERIVAPKTATTPAPSTSRKSGLHYREKQELADLPAQIEAAEAEHARVEALLSDPTTYQPGSAHDPRALTAALADAATRVEALYERWSDLESRSG
ncbi:MAG: ABC-F family ATP-binding cassette domain-containing protein [Alphaproteobacteria bacterium]|nr:ABC-F family ATP-binding cassette domain-containing protein [Alphaproteobacteria bacterium]